MKLINVYPFQKTNPTPPLKTPNKVTKLMDRRDFLKFGMTMPLLPSIALNDALAGVATNRTNKQLIKKNLLITSGKAGVGKTLLTGNIASILSNNGVRVLVVDLSQKDHFTTSFDLEVISNNSDINIVSLNELNEDSNYFRVERHFNNNDIIIYDGSELNNDIGIMKHLSEDVDVLMVSTDDPQSVVGTFKSLKKFIHSNHNFRSVSMIVNKVVDKKEAEAIHSLTNRVCNKYINMNIGFAGIVGKNDELLRAFRNRHVSTEVFAEASWFDPTGALSFLTT